jgi:hypothetical protein
MRDWERCATTDPSEIIARWARSAYNVAIATGPAGLVVLDLDDAAHHGHTDLPVGHPRHGQETLARAAQEAGEPYPTGTYAVRTPTGGIHLYFTAPEEPLLGCTQARIGPLIDTRAHGGYIIAAGSVTAAGRYTAVNTAPILPLPHWLIRVLTSPPLPTAKPLVLAETRADAYHRAALADEASKVHRAPPGLRRHTLLRAAARLARLPGLDDTQITDALMDASARHITDGAYTNRERQRAISDGIAWGRLHPRPITHRP